MSQRKTCVFCQLSGTDWLRSTAHAGLVRDRYPVAPGHALVVPRRHVTSIFDLGDAELRDLWELIAWYRTGGDPSVAADGWNIGVNDGAAAGQTVGHAHVHVIPRRNGDIADARGGIRWIFPEKARYWD